MIAPITARWAIWGICALTTAGVIVRPFKLPEAIWAVMAAAILVILGLLPVGSAGIAVMKGADVYLFLTGMMLLSETARREGLFDWVAVHAVTMARGSTSRLFTLVFAVGTVVTVFLSNDATAVVLTPAVYAAARKAKADPLPMLFACAFIANAASFVLPISNPANLVMFSGQMPALGSWLASFALPSLLAIGITFGALRWTQRDMLSGKCETQVTVAPLKLGGVISLAGILVTAVVLVTVSAFGLDLGLPTFVCGTATVTFVCVGGRQSPVPIARGVSWSVLPLVAGLFVLVEALTQTGLIDVLGTALRNASSISPAWSAIGSGSALALGSNLVNNLPAGLIASATVAQAASPRIVTDALLIGVDLGPNLSITGSLATILWLTAIRREGENVGFWQFLKVGAIVMPPALLAALAARMVLA